MLPNINLADITNGYTFSVALLLIFASLLFAIFVYFDKKDIKNRDFSRQMTELTSMPTEDLIENYKYLIEGLKRNLKFKYQEVEGKNLEIKKLRISIEKHKKALRKKGATEEEIEKIEKEVEDEISKY